MRSITSISKIDLEEYLFPGTDAAILRIEHKLPQKDLEDAFGDLEVTHRFYSTDTGWDVKFPYFILEDFISEDGSDYSIDDFIREPRGWDHEHCSFCNANISIGDHAFTTEHEEGGYYVICNSCSLHCK